MLEYIRVTAPYYIPAALAAMLLGIVTSGGSVNSSIFLAAISLLTLIAGFNTFNGLTDIQIDKVNKPSRPIPSGEISEMNAFLYSIFLYAVSLFTAYNINLQFFYLTISAVILTLLYSLPIVRLRKRFFINNLTGGILYGLLCPLLGWSLSPSNPIPIFMFIFTFLLAFALSIAKDFEDVLGDKIFSIKTLPVVFGVKNSAWLISNLLIASWGYFYFAITLNLIELKYLITIVSLPAFLYFSKEIYRRGNPNPKSVESRRGIRKMFYSIIFLGIFIEIIISVIAIYY